MDLGAQHWEPRQPALPQHLRTVILAPALVSRAPPGAEKTGDDHARLLPQRHRTCSRRQNTPYRLAQTLTRVFSRSLTPYRPERPAAEASGAPGGGRGRAVAMRP